MKFVWMYNLVISSVLLTTFHKNFESILIVRLLSAPVYTGKTYNSCWLRKGSAAHTQTALQLRHLSRIYYNGICCLNMPGRPVPCVTWTLTGRPRAACHGLPEDQNPRGLPSDLPWAPAGIWQWVSITLRTKHTIPKLSQRWDHIRIPQLEACGAVQMVQICQRNPNYNFCLGKTTPSSFSGGKDVCIPYVCVRVTRVLRQHWWKLLCQHNYNTEPHVQLFGTFPELRGQIMEWMLSSNDAHNHTSVSPRHDSHIAYGLAYNMHVHTWETWSRHSRDKT